MTFASDGFLPVISPRLEEGRYADAIRRLVERLSFRQTVTVGDNSRGKRRKKKDLLASSNSLRVYLKAIERWSFYCIEKWGEEINARDVNTDIAVEYAKWLKGEGPGPDVRQRMMRSIGEDVGELYVALEKAVAIYGQVNIIQIAEQMDPAVCAKYFRPLADLRSPQDLSELHRLAGKLARVTKIVHRFPSTEEIRAKTRKFWTETERNPLTYTYTIVPLEGLSTSSVCTHLASLSAVWAEFTVKTDQYQTPLAFNPWKSVYARWSYRLGMERRNAKERGDVTYLTTPMVKAMLRACAGSSLEDRRDTLALMFLAFLGLRAEELAGLLRRDVIAVEGVVNLAVLGKGNKVRRIPLYSDLRDALTLLTGSLEEQASRVELDASYTKQYAAALLTPDAPLIPSLARWGCNQAGRNPEEDAMEPLDVSGVRALLHRVAGRARVRDVATGVVRPFSECTEDCEKQVCKHEMKRVHPHAFRHYAATSAQQSGVPLQDVQEVLGHTDIRTTKGYIQVSPQKSMSFSAGVFRILNRQPSFTPEELNSFKVRGSNPLDDNSIVDAEPDEERVYHVSSPGRTPDEARVVAAPSWAYEGGEILKQYLPQVRGRNPTSTGFSSYVNSLVREFEVQLKQLENSGLVQSPQYTNLLTQMWRVKSRHLWNHFRIGSESRLPWFAGRTNRWKEGQMAPILSYGQVAPEEAQQWNLIDKLKSTYDNILAESGISSAYAMLHWLSEVIEVGSTQFAQDMIQRSDSWVLFDEEVRVGDETVVREHAIEPVCQWFEKFAWTLRPTSKTPKGAPESVMVLETLPSWFWEQDALLDLPADERSDMAKWITGIQGQGTETRLEHWVSQVAARCARDKYTQLSLIDVATQFASVVSSTPSDVMEDVKIWFGRKEENASHVIWAALARRGISRSGANAHLRPCISGHPADYVLDPSVSRFDLRATIVHDNTVKTRVRTELGEDSQSVSRRTIRALWEERKAILSSRSQNLKYRHLDVYFARTLPSFEQMNDRLINLGWVTPPASSAPSVFRTMWEGFVDIVREACGVATKNLFPIERAREFWSKELEDLLPFLLDIDRDIPIASSSLEVTHILGRIKETADTKLRLLRSQPTTTIDIKDIPDFAANPQLDAMKWVKANCPMFAHNACLVEGLRSPDDATRDLARAIAACDSEEAYRQAYFMRQEEENIIRDELINLAQIVNQAARPLTMRRMSGLRKNLSVQRHIVNMLTDDIFDYTTPTGVVIDNNLFLQLLECPETYLAVGSASGAAAFLVDDLRRTVKKVYEFKDLLVHWNWKRLQLEFLWDGDRQGIIFRGFELPDSPSGPGLSTRELYWDPPDSSPRPTWHDPRPWEPRWPGYPNIDPDENRNTMAALAPWPKSLGRLSQVAMYGWCMQQYAWWKRRNLRASEVPEGWTCEERTTTLGVHPVEVIFAAVRSV